MKQFILGLVFPVLLLLCSCRNNNSISHVYETPFPLDELNAYFDIPYDTVLFANGQGDTIELIYALGHYGFNGYSYHGEWGEGGDEPEGGEKWTESEGRESYSRTAYYYEASQFNAAGNDNYPYLGLLVTVDERAAASIGISLHDKDLYQSYNAQIRLRKPSNDIFALFDDTVYLSECYYLDINAACDDDFEIPSDKDHAIVERGKGIVEYTVAGSEVWHLVE